MNLNFTSTVTEHMINISIVNDSVVESIEQFFSNLQLLSMSTNVRVFINPAQATISIRSDDGLLAFFMLTISKAIFSSQHSGLVLQL